MRFKLVKFFRGLKMEENSKQITIPPYKEAFKIWLKIGMLSFGGPAGQIAMMHRTLVEEKQWIDEARFLHALNYCMLLPVNSDSPIEASSRVTTAG
jgi:hypothetical protein